MEKHRESIALVLGLMLDFAVLYAGYVGIGVALASVLTDMVVLYEGYGFFEGVIIWPALTVMIGAPVCVMYWHMRRHTSRRIGRVGAWLRLRYPSLSAY